MTPARRALRCAVAVLMLLALLALRAAGPASAATAMRFGDDLSGIACPSATECVAVGGTDASRFDPATPRRRPVTHRVSRADLLNVACPSARQCSAVDEAGHEVTFAPGVPGSARAVRIVHGSFSFALACPSTSQCTAVSDDGSETTFDPATSRPAPAVTIDSDPNLLAIDCPAVTQCTAVGGDGEQITFDPAAATAATSVDLGGGSGLSGIACPSLTQCTAVGPAELTFNPAAPGTPVRLARPAGDELQAIACPTTTACTAVLRVGSDRNHPSFAELSFDPTAAAPVTPVLLAHRLPSLGVASVACPSATQCTAVFNGEAVTFDPARPGVIAPTITVIALHRSSVVLACRGDSACAGRIGTRAYRVPMNARRRLALPAHRHGRLTVTVAGGEPISIK